MSWACFWTERTGEAEISLRRYFGDGANPEPACPVSGRSYHDISVVIGRAPLLLSERGTYSALGVEDYLGRPEWPTACSCGFVFDEDDDRQVNQEPIHRNVATGEEWPARNLPVGAMFDAPWHRAWGVGPDDISLMVVLPPEREDTRSHWWHVDGPSRNDGQPGPGWTRTGDPRNPPTLSVAPSILTSDYHGYLTSGVLTDPL